MFNHQNKIAVITGAASGIGLQLSKDLLGSGAKVSIIDQNPCPAELQSWQQHILYHQGDLTDADFVADAVAQTATYYGRIDYLANVAGALWFGRDCSLVDIDLDIWDQVLAINLKSLVHTTRAVIPVMLKNTEGAAMVHFSSSQCLRGDDKPQDAYQAAKAGVIALSKSIAVQYGRHHIRSNVIIPGPTYTPLQARWDDDPEGLAALSRHIPLGRVGSAQDMANGCLFLLSDAANFITGTELIIDGGLLALP